MAQPDDQDENVGERITVALRPAEKKALYRLVRRHDETKTRITGRALVFCDSLEQQLFDHDDNLDRELIVRTVSTGQEVVVLMIG